jgi:4-cresol dehydrogenase (hydroxylating)
MIEQVCITRALTAWRRLLGPDQVLDGGQAQLRYGADTGGGTRRIAGALLVRDATDLPAIVRIAAENQAPLHPISTGHNWGYGTALPSTEGCTIVDLSGLQRILHFDAELGVVTVEPGVTQGMLSEFLVSGGHPYMVPVTGAGPTCSLVGNALERGYGITPYTDHFAAVTDVEAVLPDGSVYRTALREMAGDDLARLFKWGIGPYTAGLFAQSGAGIVTRMSILLARRPERVEACFFRVEDDTLLEGAVACVRSILTRLPGVVGGINLMNRHRMLAMTAPYPRDRLGPDGLIPQAVVEEMGRKYRIPAWTGFITLYGTKDVVAAARKEIRRTLKPVSRRPIFIKPTTAKFLAGLLKRLPQAWSGGLSRTVNTVARSLELVNGYPNETALPLAYWLKGDVHRSGSERLDPARDGCGLLWYAPLVPMRPAHVRQYVSVVSSITRSRQIEPLLTLTSITSNLFDSTLPVLFQRNSPEEVKRAQTCVEDLIIAGREIGVFPYRFGSGIVECNRLEFGDYQPKGVKIHQQKSDLGVPRTISPGRYW